MEINNASRDADNWMSVGMVLTATKILVSFPNHRVCSKYKVSIEGLDGMKRDYLFYPDDKVVDFIGKKITYVYKRFDDESICDILHIYN
ncbi:hypothetical protein [Pantoea ananatis]|uniref:hypothetical protein n=1 Tax=Pantoea ananas TaxID=553 RepID=UPI000CEB3E26|nr:hypothetical protein [Pantoea ananatis]AVG78109.1 hypothetical protein B9Q16_19685 [Pantoea ananatis]